MKNFRKIIKKSNKDTRNSICLMMVIGFITTKFPNEQLSWLLTSVMSIIAILYFTESYKKYPRVFNGCVFSIVMILATKFLVIIFHSFTIFGFIMLAISTVLLAKLAQYLKR